MLKMPREQMKSFGEIRANCQEAGADRLRYCDTVGILDPLTAYEKN